MEQALALTINGPIRGGKNHVNITRTGHRYPNKTFAIWRDDVVRQLRIQCGAAMPAFLHPCRIEVKYWKPDLRHRDVPAAMDSIWHCLERSGIIADDCLLEDCLWLNMGLDRVTPRAEILISAKSPA